MVSHLKSSVPLLLSFDVYVLVGLLLGSSLRMMSLLLLLILLGLRGRLAWRGENNRISIHTGLNERSNCRTAYSLLTACRPASANAFPTIDVPWIRILARSCGSDCRVCVCVCVCQGCELVWEAVVTILAAAHHGCCE